MAGSGVDSTFHGQDFAKVSKGALDLKELNQFLDDMRHQPNWRDRAEQEADFYDGNQLDHEELASLKARGLPPVVVNLIAPTIDLVLGMEAKTRTDWVVKGENEKTTQDLVDALSFKLQQAERKTRADRACADAYAKQMKIGLGWVEVRRNTNPFEFPYIVQEIDRREIWFDWRAKDPELKDARYLVRRRWFDADVLVEMFPDHAELIRHSSTHWAGWDIRSLTGASQEFAQDWQYERDWGWEESEWRDATRPRMCLYEVWYRRWIRGDILRLPSGRVVEYDKKNAMHSAAVSNGLLQPEKALFPKMRRAYFIGPHRVSDDPSPYPHADFPYIPFWGKREDKTGTPYGLIRPMIPLQKEVNRRRAKMLWQLSAVRVVADKDAVDDWSTLGTEISRPDAHVKLNPARQNRQQTIQIDDHQGLSEQQYKTYLDSKDGVNRVVGVFQSQLGEQVPGQSGIAINQLIEQGTTTLAELNDNFRFARTCVGERLLAMVQEDLAKMGATTVRVEQPGKRWGKSIPLNTPARDDVTGIEYRENDVMRAQLNLELADVPTNATYRGHLFTQLTELVKGLPEQYQAMLLPMVLEASDFPGRWDMIDKIRKANGELPEDLAGLSPDEQKQVLAAMAKMKRDEERIEVLKDLEILDRAAGIAKTMEETDKLASEQVNGRVETAVNVLTQAATLMQPDAPPEGAEGEAAPAPGEGDTGIPPLEQAGMMLGAGMPPDMGAPQ